LQEQKQQKPAHKKNSNRKFPGAGWSNTAPDYTHAKPHHGLRVCMNKNRTEQVSIMKQKHIRQKNNIQKVCRVCSVELRGGENWNKSRMKNGEQICNACYNEYQNQYRYKKGLRHPMGKNKNCSMYLGVHIAEKYLAQLFDNVEKMPINNPGFDFICSRDYKIDVKSACRSKRRWNDHWQFRIKQNTITDYFLCLAFNNRETLEPEHLWLIPGEKVNHLSGLSITDSNKSLSKWSEYELDAKLEKMKQCCLTVRSNHE